MRSLASTPIRPLRPLRTLRVVGAALLVVLALACRPDPGPEGEGAPPPETAARETADPADPPRSTGRAAPAAGTAWVIFGTDTVVAEIARTTQAKQRGLMGREEVPAGTGMLFMYDRAEPRSFWMENTLVDLDIAFMDPGFQVLEIYTMEAGSTEFTRSRSPAQFALEVPAGWFAEHGIEPGAVPSVIFGR